MPFQRRNHAAVESGLKQYAGKRALSVRPLATDEGCFVKVTQTQKNSCSKHWFTTSFSLEECTGKRGFERSFASYEGRGV